MHNDNNKRLRLLLLALSLPLGIGACASNKGNGSNDPLEKVNRLSYKVTDKVDVYVLKPVAEVYRDRTPKPVRTGFTNFFNNIVDLNTIPNDLLQGKVQRSLSAVSRVLLNTTLGLGGFVDVASPKLPRHVEDLGQTLGHWGVREGAYLYIPLSGPSSLRDAPDLISSTYTNPLFYLSNTITFPIGLVWAVNNRANVLDATKVRDEAALDPYSFTRAAYREKRLFDIYDGNPPAKSYEQFDDDDEPEPEPATSSTTRRSPALAQRHR
jgi:phospholipid-binding lipoprotein MlaA